MNWEAVNMPQLFKFDREEPAPVLRLLLQDKKARVVAEGEFRNGVFNLAKAIEGNYQCTDVKISCSHFPKGRAANPFNLQISGQCEVLTPCKNCPLSV